MKQFDFFRSALIFVGLSLAAMSISAGIGGGYGGKEEYEYEEPDVEVQGNALQVDTLTADINILNADLFGTLEDGSKLGFYLGAYYYENQDGWSDYYTVYDTTYSVRYIYSKSEYDSIIGYYEEDELYPIYNEFNKDSIIGYDTIYLAGDPITRPYPKEVVIDSVLRSYVEYEYDCDSIVYDTIDYYKEDEIYTYRDFDPEDSSKFVYVYDTIHFAGDPIIEESYLIIDSTVTTYVEYNYYDTIIVYDTVGYYEKDYIEPIYYHEDSYIVGYDTIHHAGDPIIEYYYTEIITDSVVEPYIYSYQEEVWIDTVISGWYVDSYYAYFCGAISEATDLTVPDSIYFNGRRYPVSYCGRNSSQGVLDFTNATSVTSLTLPATINFIYTLFPSTITGVHFQGENPPLIKNYSTNNFFNSATVWVPQSSYQAYKNRAQWGDNGWNNATILYEGWAPITLTINIETAGTLMDSLLAVTPDLSDFDTLIITGYLNDEDLDIFYELTNIKMLDLSGTVAYFSNFYGCSNLTKLETVVLPPTVNSIGYSAFQGCSSLKNINLDNIINIKGYAFAGCLSLTQLDLSSVYNLEHDAFNMGNRYSDGYYDDYGNNVSPALTSVILSDVLTDIPYYCFAGCKLTSINFPASLLTIGSQALDSIKFDSIAIPEGVTRIDEGNFLNAKIITLPSTIVFEKYDGNRIGGDKLTDIYLNQVTPQWNVLCSNYANQITLHVPYFSVSSYINSNYGWNRFASIVPMEGNVELLTVNDYLELTDPQGGFAEKAEIDLLRGGHLTINSTSALSLGTFMQEQSTSEDSYYYWDKGGISTLIADNAIQADSIVLKLQVRTGRWNFISFPFDVNVSDIEFPEGTLWVIRKYSGADRAALTGNTWQNMSNGTTLQAGEGYILHCATENDSEVEFTFHSANNATKNNIFAYQDVEKPLNKYDSEFAHNKSWNLVGNPYPAFFDISKIEHTGVITVYNGGYYNDDYYYGGNSYTAFNPQDDDYTLLPNQAFFVQCPDNATSMTFKAEGRSHEQEYYYDGDGKLAPARTETAAKSSRLVLNFTLANADFSDRTRIVINPDAKADYEISCDASKFMSDDASLQQVYIMDGGIRYAIDERPLGEGVFRLGMRIGKSGVYTIDMNVKTETDMIITLTDKETGKQVNLKEGSYSFSAQAGTIDNRFVLTIEEVPAIDDQNPGEQPLDDQTRVFQTTGSVNDGPVYDVNGRLIPSTQKGINIINKDGNYQKVLK